MTGGLDILGVKYKESDKILTVLSEVLALITVKARGARRKGSRLLAGTQLFCYSQMTLFESCGRLSLDECDVINSFSGLQKSIESNALACYFCEVLATEAEGVAPHPDTMRLALNSLFALCSEKYKRACIKPAFELRFLALSGYTPDAHTLERALEPGARACATYILKCER